MSLGEHTSGVSGFIRKLITLLSWIPAIRLQQFTAATYPDAVRALPPSFRFRLCSHYDSTASEARRNGTQLFPSTDGRARLKEENKSLFPSAASRMPCSAHPSFSCRGYSGCGSGLCTSFWHRRPMGRPVNSYGASHRDPRGNLRGGGRL
ncbi:hypothetical protein JZ751_018721 [Albula glossodonta]|uniref:Uncharacterized protein n=1 Tax=Albula glossodonta TaxID=121402 RepID=A0A8T2NVY5_9TELE|nr:hypothetical protein JZ751_018721 [Albula glossodonta]